jgi:hypothetical protein
MSVKTLHNVQSVGNAAPVSAPRTYSIAPRVAPEPVESLYSTPAELEIFLDGENPLGCIRGVMWVMAFNAAVFLLGFLVWQSCKYLG